MSGGSGKFYCNIGAFSAEERARYSELTKKLLGARQATTELENGFEFQFSTSDVSFREAAEWVTWESKCCPFFDFLLALKEEGQSLRLQLSGAEGVKPFIRTEFGLK